VLGVVKTMGSIDKPPAVLGGMIGSALVGTFMGVLLAYGIVAPMAGRLKQVIERTSRSSRGQAGHHRLAARLAAAAGGRKRALGPGPCLPPGLSELLDALRGAKPWPPSPKRGKNEPPPPIIVKKITVVAGGHHGGAWKVAYADFVTAMMAFFLLLWLLGATTEKQRKGMADYFTPTLVKMKQESAGFQRHAGRHNPSTRLKQNIAQFDMGGTSLPSGATVINAQPEGMATGKVGKKH
jgi:hypothetical protein